MLSTCGAGKKLLGVPWTAKRSNQSILKETNSDYSLEELMQKLTPGYFLWPPDLKSQLTGKNPDAGKGWRHKKRTAEDEMSRTHHWHDLSKFLDIVKGREAWKASVHGVTKSGTRLTNWTTTGLLFRKYASKKKSEVIFKVPQGWGGRNRILCLGKLSFKSEGEILSQTKTGTWSPVDQSPKNS